MRTRPSAGALVLAGVAAVLVLIVLAAYHGSGNVPASECSRTGALVRRMQSDVAAARHAFATTGGVPPEIGSALVADDRELASAMQQEQSADMAFDERAIPVLDDLTRLASDDRGSVATAQVGADLGGLATAVPALVAFCA